MARKTSSIMRNAKRIKAANHKAATKMKHAADKVVDKEEQWVNTAHSQLKKARKQWDSADKAISEYIKENPKKAAAIAAGVGTAVGVAIAALGRKR